MRARRSVALALGLALTAPVRLVNAADPVSLELPKAPAGDRAVLVAGADARGAAMPRARVLLDYATEPLVVLGAQQHLVHVVREQLWVEPALSFAFAHRALVFADVPLLAQESGDPPPDPSAFGTLASGFALGDPRLGARVRALGEADSSLKVAAGVEAWLPLGTADYGSDDAWRARPSLSASLEGGRVHGSVELGYLFRKSVTVPSLLPLRAGSALTFGVAAQVALDAAARVEVGPEVAVALGTSEGTSLFDPRSTAGQALLAARWTLPFPALVLGAWFGPGIGQGVGAADLRAVVSIGFSPEEPPPPPDSDDDLIADTDDACPRTRGVPSGDPMMNGCPEIPTDTDGDAVADVRDACPREPGRAHSNPRLHGCPEQPDADRDEIPDATDACPAEPGVRSAEPERNGCPAPSPAPLAKVMEREIVIAEQVQFETNTARVRAESDLLLGAVAQIFVDHPDLTLVEVQGHTDTAGSAELNRTLSEDRANAVVAWLVAHGVARERLRAKGYGADRPLADNATDEGRAKNRRVEFRVVERKEPPR